MASANPSTWPASGTLVAVMVAMPGLEPLSLSLAGLLERVPTSGPLQRLTLLALFSSLPAALVGLALETRVEDLLHRVPLLALTLAGFGVLIAGGRRSPRRLTCDLREAFLVVGSGLAQCRGLRSRRP